MRTLITFLLTAAMLSPQQIIITKKKAGGGGGSATYITTASGSNTASGTTLVSSTFDVAAGQTIIVVAWGGAVSTTGVSCNGQALTNSNLAWTASAYFARVWYLLNANAGTGVTCTATYDGGSTYRKIRVVVFSGIATTNALKQTACNVAACNALTAAGTTRTTANVTTTDANTVHIAFFLEWDFTVTYTGQNSYTLAVQGDGIGTTDAVLYRNLTSTGTYPSANLATTNTSDQYMGFYTVWLVQ